MKIKNEYYLPNILVFSAGVPSKCSNCCNTSSRVHFNPRYTGTGTGTGTGTFTGTGTGTGLILKEHSLSFEKSYWFKKFWKNLYGKYTYINYEYSEYIK